MIKVLIIEDDDRIRQVTQMSLEMMTEWKVLMANSGWKGLEIAEKEQPDLIILDMMMPDLSGEETIEKLKNNPQTKDLRIILLTAKSNLSNSLKEMGIQGIIKKPFDALTLADEIKKIIKW